MNGNADQNRGQATLRLVRLLARCFEAVDCVDGLEQQLDEARRLVEAVSPVCDPEVLARIVAALDIWAVSARAGEERWDFREEGLADWLASRPSARVWVTGEAVDCEPIAQWLMDQLGAGDE